MHTAPDRKGTNVRSLEHTRTSVSERTQKTLSEIIVLLNTGVHKSLEPTKFCKLALNIC